MPEIRHLLDVLLVVSPCSTAVFGLVCHIHIGRQPLPYILRTERFFFHGVPFSKCTYMCCRRLFVGKAYASPLSPTLHKY